MRVIVWAGSTPFGAQTIPQESPTPSRAVSILLAIQRIEMMTACGVWLDADAITQQLCSQCRDH
jgi:hypothetical protein